MQNINTTDRDSYLQQNGDRLTVLLKLAMIDSPEEPFFDRLAQIASEVIGTPVSLMSMVTETYQFFKSSVGLPEPWQSQRQTPLTHSFCQHVVEQDRTLVIEDARQHPLVKDNLAIPDLNVIGYLGVPVKTEDGHRLGSFCVIDGEPRQWTDNDIAIMEAFADVVNAEIDTRAAAYKAGQLEAYIESETLDIDALQRDLLNMRDTKQIIVRLKDFANEISTQSFSGLTQTR